MKRCLCCNGSGIVIGLGHVKKDCSNCNGKGMTAILKLNKESKSFKSAVNKASKKYTNLSKENIENMIEEEFANLVS